MLALKPYWGKPAVRNFRGGNGNVGIIRSPVRAIALLDPNIAALRRRVRQAGGLVVHTQSVRKPDALEFTLFKNVVRKVEGTWGAEFVDELKPQPGEPVVVKYLSLI